MNEYCQFSELKTAFFNGLHLMDTNDVISKLKPTKILIDQNLMYIDNESKRILSVSPLAAKFLNEESQKTILNLWTFHRNLRSKFPDLQVKYLVLTDKEPQLKRDSLVEVIKCLS